MRREIVTAKSGKVVVGSKDVTLPENFDELIHKYTDQTDDQKFNTWKKARVVEIQNSMRTPPKMDERTKKIVSGVKSIKEGSVQERVVQFILDNPGITEKEIIIKMREIEKELSTSPKK